MKSLKKDGINKCYFLSLLILISISCNSRDKDEYEILNIAVDKCVFKATDPKEIAKIADHEKISLKEALDILDNKMQNQQYTFSMSDTLLAADLPEDVWSYLHGKDIFENKTYNESIFIDFNKIKTLKNRKRVNKSEQNNDYLGHFKFHRVLFDQTRETAYILVDVPRSKNRVSGSFGLTLKKENGKWRLYN